MIILCISGCSKPYEGRIIQVIDGDTYVFQTEEGSFIVRMQGIDAPERDQLFSRESAEFLKRCLNKNAVTVKHGYDQYDRTLGTLFVDSININLLSIKGGYSWHYKRYSSSIEYARAEKYARSRKLGLWNLKNPIAPWDWRQMEPEVAE